MPIQRGLLSLLRCVGASALLVYATQTLADTDEPRSLFRYNSIKYYGKPLDYAGPYFSFSEWSLASSGTPHPNVDLFGATNVPLDIGVNIGINSNLKNVRSVYGGFGVYNLDDKRLYGAALVASVGVYNPPTITGVDARLFAGGVLYDAVRIGVPTDDGTTILGPLIPQDKNFPDRVYTASGDFFLKTELADSACNIKVHSLQGKKSSYSCRAADSGYAWIGPNQPPDFITSMTYQMYYLDQVEFQGKRVRYIRRAVDDILTEIVHETEAGTVLKRVQLTFDGIGAAALLQRVATTEYIVSGDPIVYTYDLSYTDGFLVSIIKDTDATKQVRFGYDAQGRLSQIDSQYQMLGFAKGTTEFQYDSAGRISRVSLPSLYLSNRVHLYFAQDSTPPAGWAAVGTMTPCSNLTSYRVTSSVTPNKSEYYGYKAGYNKGSHYHPGGPYADDDDDLPQLSMTKCYSDQNGVQSSVGIGGAVGPVNVFTADGYSKSWSQYSYGYGTFTPGANDSTFQESLDLVRTYDLKLGAYTQNLTRSAVANSQGVIDGRNFRITDHIGKMQTTYRLHPTYHALECIDVHPENSSLAGGQCDPQRNLSTTMNESVSYCTSFTTLGQCQQWATRRSGTNESGQPLSALTTSITYSATFPWLVASVQNARGKVETTLSANGDTLVRVFSSSLSQPNYVSRQQQLVRGGYNSFIVDPLIGSGSAMTSSVLARDNFFNLPTQIKTMMGGTLERELTNDVVTKQTYNNPFGIETEAAISQVNGLGMAGQSSVTQGQTVNATHLVDWDIYVAPSISAPPTRPADLCSIEDREYQCVQSASPGRYQRKYCAGEPQANQQGEPAYLHTYIRNNYYQLDAAYYQATCQRPDLGTPTSQTMYLTYDSKWAVYPNNSDGSIQVRGREEQAFGRLVLSAGPCCKPEVLHAAGTFKTFVAPGNAMDTSGLWHSCDGFDDLPPGISTSPLHAPNTCAVVTAPFKNHFTLPQTLPSSCTYDVCTNW